MTALLVAIAFVPRCSDAQTSAPGAAGRARTPRPAQAGRGAAEADAAAHLRRAAVAAAARDWHAALNEYYGADASASTVTSVEGIANAHYQLGEDLAATDAYTRLLAFPVRLDDTTARNMWAVTKASAEARLAELAERRRAPARAPVPADAPTTAIAPSQPSAPAATVAPPPDPRLWQEHGHMLYRAIRTPKPPRIDGVLDDAIWSQAPADNRFRDAYAKPFGLPMSEPTSIRVAYDNDYIYVAYRCEYKTPGARDDWVPPDEDSLLSVERVFLLLDARHDHTNARAFAVTRTGARGDFDITQNGGIVNSDWRGIWDVASKIRADGSWDAEFAVPWSTVGLPNHDDESWIGINFARVITRLGIRALWSLPSPAPTPFTPSSFYGHLGGVADVHPGRKLYVQPFLVSRYRSDRSAPLSTLRDFTGTGGNGSVYAGLYSRFRPIGPLQIDVSINPDFSQTPPDQAIANLDRFELVYPETRPFFAEDRARFEFGTDNAQLFYSRRAGLRTDVTGGTTTYTEVPVLYAGKAVVRDSGTEVAVMNVGVSTPDRRISLADKITVVRFNHLFDKSMRIGNVILHRDGPSGTYLATGVDGAVSFMNENLVLSGFLAESATAGAPPGGVGFADVHWDSADFEARLSYLDVASTFDPQLGYFQQTGVRSVTAAAGYTPIIRNDFVYEVDLRAQVTRAKTQSDDLVYDRGNASFQATLINRSIISVAFLPAVEGVTRPFTIAGGRVKIPVGHYPVNNLQVLFESPKARFLDVALGYTEGELFYGYQRSPQLQWALNVKAFSASMLYRLLALDMGADHLVGHQVSSRVTYVYTPKARSQLAIETNTLDPRATVQLTNSLMFGELSGVALVLLQSADSVDAWFSRPNSSAFLSFGYGFSVL